MKQATRDGPQLETEPVYVRRLRPDDFERVVSIDAKSIGRRREEYFRIKLELAIQETGVEISLAAELDGIFVGFLIARLYYGEFGSLDPAAVLEVLGVDPDFRGRGVGRALVRQLRTNLLALGVRTIQTEVHWDDQLVMAFFQREGFRPAPRLCLDLDCEEHRRREDNPG